MKAKMTYKSFQHWLRKALRQSGTANISSGHYIRYGSASLHTHCPITLVCEAKTGKIYDPGQVNRAARTLGINAQLQRDIVGAADGFLSQQAKSQARQERVRDYLKRVTAETLHQPI
jgi:hypothetical protein